MVTFLSAEWIDALHDAASGDESLATLTDGIALAIEQHVTDGPHGDVRYHVTFDHGAVSVRPGAATAPTITFTQSYETARAIVRGEESAQRAFMTGELRVGGDLRVVLEHGDLLATVGDVFGRVRSQTDAETAPGPG